MAFIILHLCIFVTLQLFLILAMYSFVGNISLYQIVPWWHYHIAALVVVILLIQNIKMISKTD